jgi:hypothetical protein
VGGACNQNKNTNNNKKVWKKTQLVKVENITLPRKSHIFRIINQKIGLIVFRNVSIRIISANIWMNVNRTNIYCIFSIISYQYRRPKWCSGWLCWLLQRLQRPRVRISGKSWSFWEGLALDWQSSFVKK